MDFTKIPYLGEIMALGTAIIWATSVIFFKKSGEKVHPIGLNIFKNLLAFILFIFTMILLDIDFYNPDVSLNDYGLLLISGVLGIGVGDTLFFMCLNRLGAGLTAIVDCCYAPIAIGLSFMYLGESLTWFQILGVILILSAIIAATYKKSEQSIDQKNLILGIIFGVFGLFFMAVGVVIIKPVLDTQSLIWVTEIRLLGGILILLPMIYFHRQRRSIIKSTFDMKQRSNMIIGSFLGAYLAMIFWLGGLKYTQVSTASALNQTTNIFIFVFAAIFLKESITKQKTIGIISAMIGAAMVTFG
jgi:drug/metabolite transporter (DMT)-like permease